MAEMKQRAYQYSSFDGDISEAINYHLLNCPWALVNSVSLCKQYVGNEIHVMAIVIYHWEEQDEE